MAKDNVQAKTEFLQRFQLAKTEEESSKVLKDFALFLGTPDADRKTLVAQLAAHHMKVKFNLERF